MPRTALEILPLRNETWHVYCWQARAWITTPGEAPFRPFACLVLNLDKQMIQAVEAITAEMSTDAVYDFLTRTMRNPPRQSGARRGRPARIQFEDHTLAAALSERLDALGIRSLQALHAELVDEVVAELESQLGGLAALPGLLSVEGVTPELAGGFFAAAAALIAAKPWTRISDEQKFAIKIPQDEQTRFIALMGYAGMEYGVASYLRWEDVEKIYVYSQDPVRGIPEDGMRTVFFYEALETPIDDLDAAAQYGWELAEAGLYPVPLTFLPEGVEPGVLRPSPADLVFYEAAFRAILVFIDQHLVETGLDAFKAAEAEVRVPTHAGEIAVHIRYPGGTLSVPRMPRNRRERAPDQPSAFDPRALERVLGELGGGFDDPALKQAQELMYQAFEETSPRRRIALAHQALAVSPDCADAYVLLAEEEAETAEAALALYEKGIQAGRRALAHDFEEYGGHFWMRLETRPYMRARAGQANLLWSIGDLAAAAANYGEMLALNPSDNQGVRYSLLQLLLTQGRDPDAAALLDAYPEDASADFLYTRVLLAFRRSGPSPVADRLLREAMQFNAWVPVFLTGQKNIPGEQPENLAVGGEDEAASYARHNLSHWRRSDGAVDWLKKSAGKELPAKPKKRTRRGRR